MANWNVEYWTRQIFNIGIAYYCSIFSSYIPHQTVYLISMQRHSFGFSAKQQIPTDTWNFDRQLFQMQIYIIVLLLLSSGAVSGGLEKVLRLSQFIADIYQQFPHSCIFIINCEAQQQGEDRLFFI